MNLIQNSFFIATIALFLPLPNSSFAQDVGSVKRQMIQQSIQRYPGNCPCPYNRASNGSQCGGRSAWSRPGGRSPLCYSGDISDSLMRSWMARNNMQITRSDLVDTAASRETVRLAQAELNRLGCDAGIPDGIVGRNSRQALQEFAAATGTAFEVANLRSQLFLRRLQEMRGEICR